jgi:hypothetical protein
VAQQRTSRRERVEKELRRLKKTFGRRLDKRRLEMVEAARQQATQYLEGPSTKRQVAARFETFKSDFFAPPTPGVS